MTDQIHALTEALKLIDRPLRAQMAAHLNLTTTQPRAIAEAVANDPEWAGQVAAMVIYRNAEGIAAATAALAALGIPGDHEPGQVEAHQDEPDGFHD